MHWDRKINCGECHGTGHHSGIGGRRVECSSCEGSGAWSLESTVYAPPDDHEVAVRLDALVNGSWAWEFIDEDGAEIASNYGYAREDRFDLAACKAAAQDEIDQRGYRNAVS